MDKKYIEEKRRLRDFMIARGIAYDPNKKTWRCPNHNDEHPSAVIYDNQDVPLLYCPVCGQSWTVFEVAGLIEGVTEFKDKLKIVHKALGIEHKSRAKEPISLQLDEARKIYTSELVKKCVKDRNFGEIAGRWPYHTKGGEIIAVDIRFAGEKKTVLTFWYSGTRLRYSKPPILIYNLHEIIKSDKPVLIHEGAKCAEAGRVLDHFVTCSWSGGSSKAHLVDWSLLGDREIYIFPDDDEPGLKAAKEIKKKIPHAKIIKPVPETKKIKEKGADIEEVLEIMPPDELTKYILNTENHIDLNDIDTGPSPSTSSPTFTQSDQPRSGPPDGFVSMPFKILGIGDDGKANFITEAGRLYSCTLESLSKSKLMVLAGRWYWINTYDGKWDAAIDDIIRASQNMDFNQASIRGRGAWRDGDKISYHDGKETYGEFDKKKIYLRKTRADIGIMDTCIDKDKMSDMKNMIMKLSFETPADAVRCLGWSVLAPFAGALKFRPAMLLTGPSGSGKSTVANMIIKRISNCLWLNGSESTVAGVRGMVQQDSCAIMFEETERDTDKKRNNREELFSLMRVNVTDDAPDTVKGTKDGGFNSYKMQNMFGFIAIDPTIESIADENRIFRINMIRPRNQHEWRKIESGLKFLLSDENCRGIRALTWKKLKTIFSLTDRIIDAIRDKTGRDYRSSYADGLLASAFMVIWAGSENPTDEQINEMLDKYYEFQPVDDHRDESEELIDRIMDEVVEVIYNGSREKITILEGLTRVYRGKTEDGEIGEKTLAPNEVLTYKQCLARYGVRVCDDGNIAIANNNHLLKRIIGCAHDYHKILRRYCNYVESKGLSFSGDKTRRATVIKDIIVKRENEMTDDEKLKRLMF